MGQATQLLTALLGSLGFALIFNVRGRYLVTASLGGMLAWGVYLAVGTLSPDIFLPTAAASAAVTAYSEAFARLKKTPAIQYLIVGLLPLVPGGSLYYAMRELMERNLAKAGECGFQTALYALGIAAGISMTLSVIEIFKNAKRLKKKS